MRTKMAIFVIALCSAPAAAAPGAHCDKTPFTLGKPVAAAKAKNDEPKPGPQTLAAASKKHKVGSEGEQRLLANCKSGNAKKKSG